MRATATTLTVGVWLAGCAQVPSGGWQDALDVLRPAARSEAFAPVLPDAPRPTLRAGDTFVFGRGTVRRVQAHGADAITWRTTDGQTQRATPHFFAPLLQQDLPAGSQRSTLSGNPGALWPLRVGRSVSFEETRVSRLRSLGIERRTTLRWDCDVRETRHVSVPAGDFDTFHVRCEAHRADLPVRVPVQVMAWDYAPSLGHYVRRQWFEAGQARESVLSAALPAEVATPARLDRVLQRLREAP